MLPRGSCKYAGILSTRFDCLISRPLQQILTNVNTNDPPGPLLGHFNCIIPFATPEIDYRLPYNFVNEITA